MIAVMGAAGNVGRKVAEMLLGQEERVRVLEHQRALDDLAKRGAEVVKGDARNVEDLKRLFEDADAALLVLPDVVADPEFVASRSQMSRVIVDALRGSQVSHVVVVSSVAADRSDAAGPPAGLYEFEQLLSELEALNVLVLRSGPYMDYLLANLPLIQSQKINGSALKGDLRIPMVATQDVAREAAERLVRRDFAGRESKSLLGPQDVTMLEATRAIGSLLGEPNLPYVEFPPDGVKRALVQTGMSEEAASEIVAMQVALNEGRQLAGVQRTPQSTTPTRLEDFLKETLVPTHAAPINGPWETSMSAPAY